MSAPEASFVLKDGREMTVAQMAAALLRAEAAPTLEKVLGAVALECWGSEVTTATLDRIAAALRVLWPEGEGEQ